MSEAWADAPEYTRGISPRMEAQQLRALRAVFYAAASGALEALPESRDYQYFDVLMERRWAGFAHDCVLPYLYPRTRPICSPEAVQNEMTAIVEHQHGYWLAGARAALLCRRAGCASATLKDEIETAGKAVVARHAAEGRTS
jgi:hypothetical protein